MPPTWNARDTRDLNARWCKRRFEISAGTGTIVYTKIQIELDHLCAAAQMNIQILTAHSDCNLQMVERSRTVTETPLFFKKIEGNNGRTGKVEQRGRAGDASPGAGALDRREPPRRPAVLPPRHLPRRLRVLPQPYPPRRLWRRRRRGRARRHRVRPVRGGRATAPRCRRAGEGRRPPSAWRRDRRRRGGGDRRRHGRWWLER